MQIINLYKESNQQLDNDKSVYLVKSLIVENNGGYNHASLFIGDDGKAVIYLTMNELTTNGHFQGIDGYYHKELKESDIGHEKEVYDFLIKEFTEIENKFDDFKGISNNSDINKILNRVIIKEL